MNTTVKNILLWMVILVVILLLFKVVDYNRGSTQTIPFSQFLEMVEGKKLDRVTIRGPEIRGYDKGTPEGREPSIRTYAPPYADLITDLKKGGVKISAEEPREGSLLVIILQWAPILFLIGLWIFIMRQMQTGGNRAMAFGKSRAKLLTPNQKKVTFKDVAGCEEAKDELSEIIDFLKEPAKFQKLGGKIPKGVLMMGPPGTGKTLLARAVAGEANVPFFSISGSDFVEMFVGVGASRVRDLFEQGKKSAPCIIFIDEIDAVGRHRGAGLGGGHDEREQTLNALLVEMDGFEGNDGVILVAATNRPDVLDPALLRPGRFDRRVVVDRPDVKGREGILKVHSKNIPMSDDVDLSVVARGTPGFAGADLANLVNEAALSAARVDKKKVEMIDFNYAKDKVLMGAERRSMVMSDDEKKITAYHEGGHALIAAFEEHTDPLHKVTIIPRGRALGLTQQLPLEDKYTYSKEYIEAELAVMMGGRLAEEVCLGKITTGASNDFEKATEMARRMVCEWGMSDLGPLSFGRPEGEVFLGRDFSRQPDYSEDTARQIDAEVNRICNASYVRGKKIIIEHRAALEEIAKVLLEKESLDGEEIYAIIKRVTGRDVAKRPKPKAPPPTPAPAVAQPEKAEGPAGAPG
ncbi:MAG: ATP-dependent zinc metalloprotease FtsH, partial [Thermoanaerobaculia bacterium]